METGSLLAASKAVRQAKDEPSPFRMDEKKRLPRFDSQAGRAAADAIEPAGEDTLFPDAPGRGTNAVPEILGSAPLASAPTVEEVGKSKSLREALFGQRVKDRAAKAAAQFTSANSGLQQGELKLDQVKVVRNDLNESDFELAAPKAPTAINSAAKPQPKGMGGAAWSWLTAKLFSLGRRWK